MSEPLRRVARGGERAPESSGSPEEGTAAEGTAAEGNAAEGEAAEGDESAVQSPAADAAPVPGVSDGAALDELRALLNREERGRLEALESEEVDADAIAEVLPEAILRRETRDDRVARALGDTIEAGLFRSARKDPKSLAEAIHPALGPAIRGMIQATLRDSVEKLNVALENAVSPQGIRWRLQAARTGRPFSEVVMLATLVYRVEQVLLIDGESGLVVRGAHALGAAPQDADLVAAMLTAIRDFAEDSFERADEGVSETLEEIEFEGRTLLLAKGPAASLALVVSGSPPRTLRARARETLEELHVDYGEELAAFDGEDDALPGAAPLLEDLLVQEEKQRERNPVLRAVPLVVAGLLVLWGAAAAVSSVRVRGRIAALEEALVDAHGVRPLEVTRRGGAYIVRAL
ncbi:MAG: hypothetical protein AAFP86_15785, partial [Planctomycetota bacterium]